MSLMTKQLESFKAFVRSKVFNDAIDNAYKDRDIEGMKQMDKDVEKHMNKVEVKRKRKLE